MIQEKFREEWSRLVQLGQGWTPLGVGGIGLTCHSRFFPGKLPYGPFLTALAATELSAYGARSHGLPSSGLTSDGLRLPCVRH